MSTNIFSTLKAHFDSSRKHCSVCKKRQWGVIKNVAHVIVKRWISSKPGRKNCWGPESFSEAFCEIVSVDSSVKKTFLKNSRNLTKEYWTFRWSDTLEKCLRKTSKCSNSFSVSFKNLVRNSLKAFLKSFERYFETLRKPFREII